LPLSECPMALAIRQGCSISGMEAVVERPDGVRRDVLAFPRIVEDAPGTVTGAVNILLDITDSKRAERLQRENELGLNALLELMPAAVCACDFDGRITFFNRRASELWGREPQVGSDDNKFCGSLRLRWPDGTPLPHAETPMARAIRFGEEAHNQEVVIERPDQTSITVSVNIKPLYDASGRRTGAVNVFQNITALKLAENSLRESEKLFREMAECAPVLVRLATADGHCTYVNGRWTEFTGQPRESALGYGWLDAVHPEDRNSAREGFSHAAGERRGVHLEYRLHRADGSWRWVISAGAPRFNEHGDVLGFVSSVIDISERKEMEDAIRSANADLQQFAYAAAHDLQEPLRNVTIYSQLLSEVYGSRLEGEALQFLNFATQGARRMQALVDDLLAYTRLSAAESKRTDVDAAAVLQEAIEHLKPAIEESGASIEISAMPVVRAHRGRLLQVFQNLLSNAIKYRRASMPLRIRISAEELPGAWQFSVADNGIGIDPAYQEQVFGIFKRLHRSSVPGTGIGLAICRRIVEGYKGRIWVESEDQDRGSTFHFTLPF
jgi:PAS domain S-box-containing protein